MAISNLNNLITGTTLYYYTHTLGKVEFGSFIIDRIDFSTMTGFLKFMIQMVENIL